MIESEIVRPARESIQAGIVRPMAKDMPYIPYTENTLQRLAALKPRTLAVMHGSSFRGDGRQALSDMSVVIKDLRGGRSAGS